MRYFTTQASRALMLCFLAIAAISCSKEDDPLPETSMEITVVDEIGNPVQGAVVKLYSDFDGYVKDDPGKLVGSGQTSADGKIITKNLEAQKYFFSIKHTSTTIKNNWEGGNVTLQPLTANKVNTFNVVVKENAVGYLAGDGKKWKYHQVFYNDIDVTSELDACWLDNIITFYKDKSMLFSEGNTKCASSDPQEYNGTFVINGNILTTNDEIDGQDSSAITELTGGTMTLAQQDAEGNVIEITFRAVN